MNDISVPELSLMYETMRGTILYGKAFSTGTLREVNAALHTRTISIANKYGTQWGSHVSWFDRDTLAHSILMPERSDELDKMMISVAMRTRLIHLDPLAATYTWIYNYPYCYIRHVRRVT